MRHRVGQDEKMRQSEKTEKEPWLLWLAIQLRQLFLQQPCRGREPGVILTPASFEEEFHVAARSCFSGSGPTRDVAEKVKDDFSRFDYPAARIAESLKLAR